MHRYWVSLGLAVSLGMASPAFAGDSYNATIEAFKASPTSAKFFQSAYGYAVFPTIGKGGVGIGGARGTGQVYRANQVTGTATMTQLTVGLQLGGQAYSQIIFFENEGTYNTFTSGKFEFGAQASAVAITASAQAQAGTAAAGAGASSGEDAGAQAAAYQNGMAVFTYAKGGLMYEASLGGQKFKFKPMPKK